MAPFHVPVQFMLDAGRLAYGAALAVPPVLSRLAMLGAVYRAKRPGWYYLTDFGRMLLAAAPEPGKDGAR